VLVLWCPDARLPCDCPPCGANDADTDDAEGILNGLAAAGFDVCDCGERTGPAATAGLRVATVAAREADVAGVAAAEERCFDAIGAAGRGLSLAARVLEVVVDALRNEDQVREAEVDCECDDGGHEAGPDSADEVGDIADKPDGEEGERDALGGALFVVFDQLRDLGWVSWGKRQVACVR
jgi:hypothetical protein